MLDGMDERSPRSLPSRLDHGGDKGQRRDGRRRATMDPADDPEAIDLANVLRGVAVRLDAVLDDGAAKPELGAERREGIDAAFSAIVPGAGEASTEAHHRALATTVLKINASGALDIVEGGEVKTSDGATVADGVAEAVGAPGAEDASGSVEIGTAVQGEERPSMAAHRVLHDVDERLRSARERLERRRAMVARVEESGAHPWLRAIDGDLRKLGQRLLIGLLIVGASAVVSLLVT